MPKLSVLCACLLFLLAASPGAALAAPAVAGTAVNKITCTSATQKLDEEGFVAIGGIRQWVTIKGDSCANPIILNIHGGPGNPVSAYAGVIYADWEKHYTLVQWDQRGAGKTYGESTPDPDAALTLELMTQDGVALANYLTQHLGQKKLILMGGSWGSMLGVSILKAAPELFHAYIGTAQMVSYADNQSATYNRVLALAKAANDQDALAKLSAVGAPPWVNPRNFGIVRRIIRQYEAKTTTPMPAAWWVAAPGYTTPKAMADYEGGEDYSFMQFVGMKGDGMFSRFDLPKRGAVFTVPFFLVQGTEDLLTTPDISRRYFDSVTAPQKEFVLVARAGHDPNQVTLDAQYKLLQERVRPMIKQEH